MEQNDLQELVKRILGDSAFADRLLAMQEPQQAQAALAERGFALNDAELGELARALRDAAPREDGELSEDDLLGIVGGSQARFMPATGGDTVQHAVVGGSYQPKTSFMPTGGAAKSSGASSPWYVKTVSC